MATTNRANHMQSEDQRIAESVARNDWHAIAVSDQPPGFVYSCGLLTTFGHPELIIFGLETSLLYEILADMVALIRKGRVFSDAALHGDVLESGSVAVRLVHPTQHSMFLGYAMGHCRHIGRAGELKALQVFWPDAAGHFPFNRECNPAVSKLQPRLDLSAEP